MDGCMDGWMDGCPPPKSKRHSNSLGGVWFLCLAGVQESPQLAHGVCVRSTSDPNGARVCRDTWRGCVISMKSQKNLLLANVWLFPCVRVNVEYLSLSWRASLLRAKCVTLEVRYHRRHAHSLPSHLVLKRKWQPIGVPWLGGHMVGVHKCSQGWNGRKMFGECGLEYRRWHHICPK